MAPLKASTLLDEIARWLNTSIPNKSVTVELIMDFCDNRSNPILPTGNIKTFQHIINLIDNTNRWDVLPFIIEQNSMFLKDMCTKTKLKLINQLETKRLYKFHIFYTVIRWGDKELLNILIDTFILDNYANNKDYVKQLDQLISDNLAVLILRGVEINNNIKLQCEEILFNIRFKSEETSKKQEITIEFRIKFVIELIEEIELTFNGVNAMFLLQVQNIADNLYILKNLVKKPLHELPWSHMEFLLAIFINKIKGRYKVSLTYNAYDLVVYLKLFKNQLKNVMNNLSITDQCFAKLYQDFEMNRSFLALTRIAQYIKVIDVPEEDKVVLKCAIERCIQVTGENLKSSAMSPNISAKVEQVFEASAPNFLHTIRRMRDYLSHIEYFENRLKFLDEDYLKLKKELKSIYPKILDIIYMQRYVQFQWLLNSLVPTNEQSQEINSKNVKNILYSNKLDTSILEQNTIAVNRISSNLNVDVDDKITTAKIIDSDSVPYQDDYITMDLLKACIVFNNNSSKINEKLRYHFCKNFKSKNKHDMLQLLLNIIENIHSIGTIENIFALNTLNTGNSLRKLYMILIEANKVDLAIYSEKLSIKPKVTLNQNQINEKIEKVINQICVHHKLNFAIFKDCLKLENLIKDLIKSIEDDSSNTKQIFQKIKKETEIQLFNNKVPNNKRQWDAIKNQLKTLDYFNFCLKVNQLCEQEKVENVVKEFKKFLSAIYGNTVSFNLKKYVESMLKPDTNHLIKPVRERLIHLLSVEKKGKLYQAALEMCVLDILELNKDYLTDNNNSPFYESYPVLVGKVLRNHLAHYNILFDRFPIDHSVQLTAIKLIEEELIENSWKIGVINSITDADLIRNYKHSKNIILDQFKLYEASKIENLQNFKHCLLLSDVLSSLDNLSSIRCATINNNWSIFQYLLNITHCDLNLKTLAIEHNSVAIFNELQKLSDLERDECHQAVLYNQLSIAKMLNIKLVHSNQFVLGLTPLHLACLLGRFEMANFLLQCGAYTEARDEKYNTPIHIAAIMGDLNLLQLLLTNGAEINSFGFNDKAALHFACGNSHTSFVNALLSQQIPIDINNKDIYGQTPLHLAICSGDNDTITLLLKLNARIDIKDNDGNTPAHLTAVHNVDIKIYKSIIQLIKETNSILDCNNNGDTLLHLLTDYEKAILLSVEKFVDLRNKHGRTPLHCAIINNNLEIVKLLIKNGAKVNIYDKNSKNPVSYAIKDSVIDKYLKNLNLTKRGDKTMYCRMANVYGENELDIETVNEHVICSLVALHNFRHVKTTLDKINMEITVLNKNNILQYAAFNGNRELVNELLAAGGDINTQFEDRYNILDLAAFNGHLNIFEIDVIKQLKTMDAFLICAANDDVDGIMLLMNNGVDVNITNEVDLTALHCASYSGNIKAMEVLISGGAKVDAVDQQNRTPLFLASINAHEAAIKLLLNNNANINAVNYNGWAALHGAILNGSKDIVDLLLQKGADNSAIDNHQRTTVHLAATIRNGALIDLLMKGNSSIDHKCNCARTAFHTAIYESNTEAVRVLLKYKPSMNVHDGANYTPLLAAVQIGNKEICNLLLKNTAIVNATNNHGLSPLHVATATNNCSLIELLMELNADINHACECGRTALHVAIGNDKVEAIHTLMKYKPNINICDNSGNAPLLEAVSKGYEIEVVQFLKNNANVNICNNHLLTALHLAVVNNNKSLINILIKNNADINHVCKCGKTPLHTAIYNSKDDAVRILLKFKPNINISDENGNTPLLAATAEGNEIAVKLLVEQGADINAKDSNNQTAIHLAAASNKKSLIHFFVSKGLEINHKSKYKLTALHSAIYNNSNESICSLINFKSDINISDNVGNTPLLAAAVMGNENAVALLLEQNCDVNATNNNQETAIQIAARNNKITLINILAKYGININHKCKNNETALQSAVNRGAFEIIQVLIAEGADVNVESNSYTILHEAACKGYFKIVEILLVNGAFVNTTDKYLRTAMHFAAGSKKVIITNHEMEKCDNDIVNLENNNSDITQQNYNQVIQLLLNFNANINAIENKGNTPLHYAVTNNNVEIAELLIKNEANINAINDHHETPLHLAAIVNNKLLINLLLKNNVEVNHKCICGNTALNVAILKGFLETVELLLKNDADVNLTNKIQQTPIQLASTDNYPTIINLLLKKGADINHRCKNGKTAVHIAIENNKQESISMLLKFKPNINICDNNGNTPLIIATLTDNLDIADILLHMKANVNTTNNQQHSAVYLAAARNNKHLVNLLFENGADVNYKSKNGTTPVHIAANFGANESIQAFLILGVNINMIDDFSRTPLHVAAQTGNEETVDLLLKAGADVNAVDNCKNTVLHLAVITNNESLIRLLIKNGAGVNNKSEDELTPLHFAAIYNADKAIKTLVHLNADINTTDKYFRTPLVVAVHNRKADAVGLLLELGADINLTTNNDSTAIHVAAENNDEFLIKLLADNGGNPNYQNEDGRSPLFIAVENCANNAISMLLNLGAVINMPDNCAYTPLHLAIQGGKNNIEAIALLLKEKADVNACTVDDDTALHLILKEDNIGAFEALFELSEKKEQNKNTNYLETTKLLLDCNIIYIDENQSMRLNVASDNDICCLIELLIKYGANVNALNNSKSTALYYAIIKGKPKCLEILLQAGADINLINSNRNATELADIVFNKINNMLIIESEEIYEISTTLIDRYFTITQLLAKHCNI